MAFSLKHLLLVTLIVGIGLAALLNPTRELLVNAVNAIVVIILVLTAYGIWITQGEHRAFRIGFVAWCGLYYLDFTRNNLDIELGIGDLLNYYWHNVHTQNAYMAGHPTAMANLHEIGNALAALLLGVIGGWVTVYFYRKRLQLLNVDEARRFASRGSQQSQRDRADG